MAIGAVFDAVGMTQDQYYRIFNRVTNNGTQPPPGVLTHIAGPTEGGFCVIETWESEEALQQFYEATLGQALDAENVAQIQPRMFNIVNAMP
jgi:quinol monooxygenase YgiN